MELLRRLQVYENNSMSLSCEGVLIIKGSTIKQVNHKGMPRAENDGWYHFFENAKIDDMISEEKINQMLRLDGHHNIVAVIKTVHREDPYYKNRRAQNDRFR